MNVHLSLSIYLAYQVIHAVIVVIFEGHTPNAILVIAVITCEL